MDISDTVVNAETIYKDKTNDLKMMKYDREENALAYHELFEKTDSMFRLGNVMEFRMMGNVQRDVGQLMYISSNSKLIEYRYGGFYIITRIRHNWTNKRYVCDVSAVRTMTPKIKAGNE